MMLLLLLLAIEIIVVIVVICLRGCCAAPLPVPSRLLRLLRLLPSLLLLCPNPAPRPRFRTNKYKKKHHLPGENLVNHPGVLLELETGRDPLRPIVDLRFSFDREMENALETQGYEIVENVDVSSLVWGPTLGKHKRCLLWKYCMKIEKTEYQRELEGAVATQEYYNARLQRSIDFLALAEEEVDEFFARFCEADKDASGSLDMDEFCKFMGVQRTDFIVAVVKYMDEDHDGTVDFSEFVSFSCNIALLGNKQLFQILFGVVDVDNSGSIHRDELPALLDVAKLDKQQRRGITTEFEAACRGQKDGCLRQDEFRAIVERFPRVMEPIHMLQRAIQAKVMGPAWWEQRRADFKETRELLRKREDLINNVPNDPSLQVDWQDPDNVLSFKGAEVIVDKD